MFDFKSQEPVDKNSTHIPREAMSDIPHGCSTRPIKGYNYVLAVLDNHGQYIGWTPKPNIMEQEC
jgi:hypothetical protein